MKKLNKVAMLFAAAALAAPSAFAQNVDNWRDSSGSLVWMNGTNQYCWRDANWTPQTAAANCDGAIKAAVAPAAPATAAAPAPAPVATPAPAAVPAAPVTEKVTYAADAFFDFDKSVLKPEAKAKLDDLASKLRGVNVETVVSVGHTDWVGSDAYNQALSLRRAEAVKSYLVSKGVDAKTIYTEGKGKKAPVADNRTADGRAKNRRAEIEVVGNRAK